MRCRVDAAISLTGFQHVWRWLLPLTTFQTILLALAIYVAFRVARSWYRNDRLGLTSEPDLPLPFGQRIGWIAINTTNTRRVARVLGVSKREWANWRDGLETVHNPRLSHGKIFISPPLNGWTFVIGSAIPFPTGTRQSDNCLRLLSGLADKFEDVQYYFADEELGFFAWARLRRGKIGRAFAWGDEGIIWNRGRATQEERALGLKPLEPQTAKVEERSSALTRLVYPNEDHVHSLAGAWSINPMDIKFMEAAPGIGIAATPPSSWTRRIPD